MECPDLLCLHDVHVVMYCIVFSCAHCTQLSVSFVSATRPEISQVSFHSIEGRKKATVNQPGFANIQSKSVTVNFFSVPSLKKKTLKDASFRIQPFTSLKVAARKRYITPEQSTLINLLASFSLYIAL